MELKKWKVEFLPGWDKHFAKFDKETQQRIIKKFCQMEQPLSARGLHESRIQAEEAGQYRIAFEQDGKALAKRIHFVGNHKQYEKWYKEQ